MQPNPANLVPSLAPKFRSCPQAGGWRGGSPAGAAHGLSCRQLQDGQQSWGRAIRPGRLRGAGGQEQKPQPEAPHPAQGIAKCTDTSPTPTFTPAFAAARVSGKGIIPAWQHGHGLGVPPVPGCPGSFPPTLLLSHQQSGEPQLLPQGQLSAPTVPSQDPVPHQVSPGHGTW